MTTAKDVLKIAAGELGHKGGEKYWKALGFGSAYYQQPWCCIFVDWVMREAGMDIGTAMNCLTIQNALKSAGAIQVNKKTAQPGDVVIFEWDHKQDTYDHVGFCELNNNDGTLKTYEGNVSNTVARRTRSLDDVRLVFRPGYKQFTGWKKENGVYHHYTEGILDKLTWCAGEGKYAGKWYFVGKDGAPVSDTWVKSSGRWYYLKDDATMAVNEVIPWEGAYYYVNDRGQAVTKGQVTLEVQPNGKLKLEGYKG